MKHTNKLRFSLILLGVICLFSSMVLSNKVSITFQEDLSIGVGYGNQDLMFSSISDIQLDSEENIYILDGENYRIQKFNAQGQFLKSIPIKKGQGPEEISMLLGLAVHQDGFISLYDRAGGKVINLDNQGNFHSSFKLDFQATDIKHYKNKQIAILGLDNGLGIHIYSREGEWLSSFAEPFSLPSKLSQFKDAPMVKFPMKFSTSGDGKVFLLNPHKYEIHIYENGELSEKIKGKSDFFRPMTILKGKTNMGSQSMSVIFPTVSVLEIEEKTIITIRGLPVLGKEEIKNQMQIYKNQKLSHSLEIEEYPYALDSKGRLYFSAFKDGFPIMKRCHLVSK